MDLTELPVGRGDRTWESRAERLPSATGRRPVTDRLCLDRIGVRIGEHDQVAADGHLHTSRPRV